MIRKIYCPRCAEVYIQPELPAEDVADGWQQRSKRILAKKPSEHNIEVTDLGAGTTEVIPVPVLVCDFCNDQINDGDDAVAWTMWRGTEPENWEAEYTQQ